MMKKTLALLIAAICVQGVCAGDPKTESASADIEFFEKKIRPLLVEHCSKCHSAQAKKQKGGLLLDSKAGFLKGGDSGPVVVPGKPDQSRLIEAVRYKNPDLLMPPNGKLPEKETALLEEWVRRGAPYPGDDQTGLKKEGINLAEGRKFWSFQPLKRGSSPVVQDKSWPRRPIDSFILAELEKQRLAPSPAASRRTLIRRAYFDLIGLPPTPEEVEAFVRDEAADAYVRLVDRLLASHLYGERWGRVWLDLVRYCDVAEQWAESKAQPWLYRDWVVGAFNQDLPYDQFVRKQLAGDLMPAADPKDLAALGFLGLSPVYWKELQLDHNVIKTVVAEEWEERIGALTGTFLGLNAACARCHDHKFDPISTRDYYALAGVFASIRQTDRPLLPDAVAGAVRQAHDRVYKLEKEIEELKNKKPAPVDLAKQVEGRKSQMEQIRKSTPHYESPLAPAVDEASLHVLPDGPHKTKLEYKPGQAQDVALQVRGNPANPGPMVPRHFLAVFSGDAPKSFTQGSGRLELAQAIVTEGAPLAARVIINRVWKQHFGAGLVETPSDFGTQGSRPSHPALLDDLAARFVAEGWSIKWLHREIMLSATYQQAATNSEVGSRKSESTNGLPTLVDPDNRLLWRMNRRRLEIEAWRDAMLAVTGTLSHQAGGPPLDLGDAGNRRRTLYGIVKRRELHDLLRLYDFPDPTAHSPGRLPTTTPLQQLFVLNSPFMQEQAKALAARLRNQTPGTMEGQIQRVYLLLYGRPATTHEAKLGMGFLTEGKPGSQGSEASWQQYAQVLLGSNEFLYVD